MKSYTLGFAFNADKSRVLLILKNRPAWQFDKLNGIGGKLNNDEFPSAGMTREFAEETGILVPINKWGHFATMISPMWQVYCFETSDVDIQTARIQPGETERPEVCVTSFVIAGRYESVSNLGWLIALALDRGEIHGAPDAAIISYKSDEP